MSDDPVGDQLKLQLFGFNRSFWKSVKEQIRKGDDVAIKLKEAFREAQPEDFYRVFPEELPLFMGNIGDA